MAHFRDITLQPVGPARSPRAFSAVSSRVWLWLGTVPAPVLAAVICFSVYCYRPLVQSSLDNQPLRWGATLIARGKPLDFSVIGFRADAYYSFRTMPDGSVRSHTPIGSAFLAAPVFFAARTLGMRFTEDNVVLLDGLAASLLTAFAAGMTTYLSRRSGRRAAIFCGLAAGLATASWAVASRCMWQHTGAQVAFLGALCVMDGKGRPLLRTLVATALLAVTVWCRPYLVTACAVVFAFQIMRSWRVALAGAAVALAGVTAFLAYNLATSGKLGGTYLANRVIPLDPFRLFPSQFAGSLVSPNRGMFVFSPILVLAIPAVLGMAWRWRSRPREAMLACATLAAVVPRGFLVGWFGGHTYGSRHMLDVSAMMLVLASPLMGRLLAGAWWKVGALIGVCCVSALIQWLGVARDFESWNVRMGMNVGDNAWNWRQSQIMHCLTLGESTRPRILEPSQCSLEPPLGAVFVPNDPGNPRIRGGVGWQPPLGAYLVPPTSGFVFNLSRRSALGVCAELEAPRIQGDPFRVGVYWNGEKVNERVFDRTRLDFASSPWVLVPERLVHEGLNRLELRTSRVYYPGASPSPLGVTLRRVMVRPTTGALPPPTLDTPEPLVADPRERER